jgi:hypothetical protein
MFDERLLRHKVLPPIVQVSTEQGGWRSCQPGCWRC